MCVVHPENFRSQRAFACWMLLRLNAFYVLIIDTQGHAGIRKCTQHSKVRLRSCIYIWVGENADKRIHVCAHIKRAYNYTRAAIMLRIFLKLIISTQSINTVYLSPLPLHILQSLCVPASPLNSRCFKYVVCMEECTQACCWVASLCSIPIPSLLKRFQHQPQPVSSLPLTQNA